MGSKTIKVQIARFDPTVDRSPHSVVYEVPWTARMTVMNVLDYIYENLDPSVAYNSHTSCRRGACARCNVYVNGSARLSCHTEVTGDLRLEPLPRFKIVRDLVVQL